ncbi:MAG: DNA ligase D [Alphaproteobacteria bacterium]|nr:DNA ligase D [Alphaproteobacteria bacterium]
MARRPSPRRDRLATYRGKRDFASTSEPRGVPPRTRGASSLAYVMQRHAARRLHYDLRLAWRGAFRSWAVTRGPSLDPGVKRLAVEVEDHPLEYGDFEGTIPEGQYGGGSVQLWDRGTWRPAPGEDVDAGLAAGKLRFELFGERLRGEWTLVRLREHKPKKRANWLLMKRNDAFARPGAGDAALAATRSVASGRTLSQITEDARPRTAATMPRFVPPQLCLLVDRPPSGPEWIHEVKLDGYRMQLRVERKRARLLTRSGLDWTARFGEIERAARALPDCLLDGEIVALDDDGAPDFARLQVAIKSERTRDLVYFAFDVLFLRGNDRRELPLKQRKTMLRALLARRRPGDASAIRLLDHVAEPGAVVLHSACKMALEGIVSKRLDSSYRSGRTPQWTKAKCRGIEDFVIGGWTPRRDRGKTAIGALVLGVSRDGKLVHVGRVGTGFNATNSGELLRALKANKRDTSPFAGKSQPAARDVNWVEPTRRAEVEFSGWTADGLLRHASFKSLTRETDDPQSALPPRHAPLAIAGVAISHPERRIWPASTGDAAVTKGDLARYYERYGERLLRHLAHRPLSIVRAPDDIGKTFFQRHAMPRATSLIRLLDVPGQPRPFLWIADVAGLIALAQMSVVELHPWGARVEDVECPDRLVFDLDPGDGVDFGDVVAAAKDLRRRLSALGLAAFARSTGGKGLHIVVPLADERRGGKLTWPEAKQFSRLIALRLQSDQPTRFTASLAKRARAGRIFVDYLRNDRLATAIASWSPRARPGAPVACPLPWSAVGPDLTPGSCRLATLLTSPLRRDPWADFAEAARPLRDAIRRLVAAPAVARRR